MTKVYPAIFHKEDGYWVEFPDLEGCNTCGATIEEAMDLASEALGLYLTSLLDNQRELPPATGIADIKVDGNLANYIAVDVEKYIKNKG